MAGNRRDAPRPGDQPDWDSCIAWRRMLTAVVNVDLPFEPVVRPIWNQLHSVLSSIEDPIHQDNVLYYLETADDYIQQGHPYGACFFTLEALAQRRQVNGVDRLEVVGKVLCDAFRTVYPEAPSGFERTGRMRQKPGVDGPRWVEPLRGFFGRFKAHFPED